MKICIYVDFFLRKTRCGAFAPRVGTSRVKTVTTFKTTDIKFKLGQQFDEVTGDGRNCKVLVK